MYYSVLGKAFENNFTVTPNQVPDDIPLPKIPSYVRFGKQKIAAKSPIPPGLRGKDLLKHQRALQVAQYLHWIMYNKQFDTVDAAKAYFNLLRSTYCEPFHHGLGPYRGAPVMFRAPHRHAGWLEVKFSLKFC
jgi:hypothetical protein